MLDPPGGEPSDYFVTVDDSKLTGNLQEDFAVILSAVERKFEAPILSPKLLALAGWSVEI
jgi:hypothetical protein